MHPPFNGGGMLAEPFSDIIAAMTLADEQHAVKSVVVTGLIGAADFLLERNSHGFDVGNL
jgi:hypothetical protein